MVMAFVYLAVHMNTNTGTSILEAITTFVDGALLRLWRKIVTSYTLYQHLDDPTFVEAFSSTYQVLKQTFLSFGNTHPQQGPTMSVDKCIWIFKNSLFLGSSLGDREQDGACATSLLATMILDPAAAASSVRKAGVRARCEFEEVVLIEFLEALASVALVSEHDSGMTVGKKMRLAFNTVAQLQPSPEPPVSGGGAGAGSLARGESMHRK
jgi:hypothetical protein